MTRSNIQSGVIVNMKAYIAIPWSTVVSSWAKARDFIERQQDSTTIDPCPRADTVLLSLLSLLIFLIAAVFAIIFPTTTVKHFIIALNATLVSILGTTFAFDMVTSKYAILTD
jgi:hypothetical protein